MVIDIMPEDIELDAVNEETGELVDSAETRIRSLEDATSLFRKLRFVKAKVNECYDIADKERAVIDAWEKRETQNYARIAEWYEHQLKAYYLGEKEKNKKFKLSSPYGKVMSRKTKVFHWGEKEEELALQLILEGRGRVVRQKIEVNKPEFKRIYPNGVDIETGEMIVLVTEEESVSVQVEE